MKVILWIIGTVICVLFPPLLIPLGLYVFWCVAQYFAFKKFNQQEVGTGELFTLLIENKLLTANVSDEELIAFMQKHYKRKDH
jgi:hypothetical protein